MLVLVSFKVHLRAAKLPPMFHFVAAPRPRNRSSIDGCSSPVGGGPISRARGRVGASARPGALRRSVLVLTTAPHQGDKKERTEPTAVANKLPSVLSTVFI